MSDKKVKRIPPSLADWNNANVQRIYEILCDELEHKPTDEHWEGYCARWIVGEVFARAEAQLAEAKAGWDSCIADLRKAAEICRETEAQLAAANECIAELERIIASIKLADDEKADSLNSYRVDLETAIEQRDEARKEVERLSTPVTDEEWTEFYQVTPMGQEVMERERINQWLASRVKKGIAHLGSAAPTGDASRTTAQEGSDAQ